MHKPAKKEKVIKIPTSHCIRKDLIEKFICETCGKGFNEKSKLRSHIFAVHVDATEMLVCEQCGYKAKQKKP